MLSGSVMPNYATPWTVARQAPLSKRILQARILKWVVLQGIFLTQGSNPDLLHCRQILYRLSHQGSLSLIIQSLNKIISLEIKDFNAYM